MTKITSSLKFNPITNLIKQKNSPYSFNHSTASTTIHHIPDSTVVTTTVIYSSDEEEDDDDSGDLSEIHDLPSLSSCSSASSEDLHTDDDLDHEQSHHHIHSHTDSHDDGSVPTQKKMLECDLGDLEQMKSILINDNQNFQYCVSVGGSY
ncbi:unnamed protein product [Ambrosiozyma monospora]|uniref:Unnamed protein product n=1 Tax=Ambrosiozyma monospora TaxID=43982 RepID=A0ACB5UDJ5_AMBMO|nr:unnamed protein product [Ambrosiozyma monospora]